MYECNQPCPRCGGPVEWDYACHTYPQRRTDLDSEGNLIGEHITWMACMPCDSATRYLCVAHNEEHCWDSCEDDGIHDGCGWTWTWGLNPNNPRATDNETRNPMWGENEM